jgi:hypothetical protein
VAVTAALRTVPNVELTQAGTWALATGRATFTAKDLAAAVAALDCPAVRRPVIKLGHHDPINDGQPAVGWIGNMRVSDGGDVLLGDYMGLPGWMTGEVLASAYPDRSIEAQGDFRCQLGHVHTWVVTALSLLGTTEPGVGTLTSLQDVAALYGVLTATAARPGAPMPDPITAAVDTEDVRRAYYDGPGHGSWNWWVQAIYVDPPQLIVCNDETGDLYRVDYATSGDEVTFADPVRVRIEYTDVPAAIAAARSPAVVFASRGDSQPRASSPPATLPDNPKGAGMDPAKLREALGLSADASDTDVGAALAAAGLATLPPVPSPADLPAGDPPADVLPPAVPTPVAASTSDAILLDPAQYRALQAQAARGDEAWRKMREAECETVLDAAVKAGKFPPARRDHWKQLWAADPDGTKDTIGRLEAGVIPVTAAGYAGVGDESAENMLYGKIYPEAASRG